MLRTGLKGIQRLDLSVYNSIFKALQSSLDRCMSEGDYGAIILLRKCIKFGNWVFLGLFMLLMSSDQIFVSITRVMS